MNSCHNVVNVTGSKSCLQVENNLGGCHSPFLRKYAESFPLKKINCIEHWILSIWLSWGRAMNLLGFLCPCCGCHPLAVTLEVHLVQSSAWRCHSSWHLNVPETDPCLQGILMGEKSETICLIDAEQLWSGLLINFSVWKSSFVDA